MSQYHVTKSESEIEEAEARYADLFKSQQEMTSRLYCNLCSIINVNFLRIYTCLKSNKPLP